MNFSYPLENSINSENQFQFFLSQNDDNSTDEYNLFDNFINFYPKSIDFKQNFDNINNINESISINKINNEEKRDIKDSSNINEENKIDEKHQFPIKKVKNFSINAKQNLIPILPCKKKEKDMQEHNIEILIEENEDNESEKKIKKKEKKIEKEKNINFFKTEKRKKKNIINKKKIVFKVKKENIYLGSKRERIVQEEFTYEYNDVYRHDKFSDDNILRKVQVHYMSFIPNFVNNILSFFGYKEQFLKIDYEYKRNVKKEFISSLKTACIGDILKKEISCKYINYDRNINELIFTKVINKCPSLKNLFDKNYYQIFKDIYYKNERNINLNQYGLNVNIKLNEKKVKLFDDLLKKNIKSNLGNDYISKLKKYVKNNFLFE